MTTLRVSYPLPVRELVGDPDSGSARTAPVAPDAALFQEFVGIRLDMDEDWTVASLVTGSTQAEGLRDAGLDGGAFVARIEPSGKLACDVEFSVARRLTPGELAVLLAALTGYVDNAISDGLGFAMELDDDGRTFFLEPDTGSPSVAYDD